MAKGMSQRDLAEKTGISKRTIECYEQETRHIDGARLKQLCNLSIALDCKLDDLLEDKTLIESYKKVK